MSFRPTSFALPRLSRRTYILVAAVFVLLLSVVQLSRSQYSDKILQWTRIGSLIKHHNHPIDNLVTKADNQFKKLLRKQTHGPKAAARAYRKRRGRHPPPLFERWVEYAESTNALIIEDFFDSIYDNLEVFWSLNPLEIRSLTASWPNVVSVRRRNVKIARGLPRAVSGRMDLLKQIEHFLPDVDIAFSTSEQQAVIVSWENIDKAMQSAAENRPTPLPAPAMVPFHKFSKVPDLKAASEEERDSWKNLWLSKNKYWDMARSACPPDSDARSSSQDGDFSSLPNFASEKPLNSFNGFVRNWTRAKSPCVHPELRNLHGSLVGPKNDRRHAELFPLFADSKIQDVNNVILFPSRYYWNEQGKQHTAKSGIPENDELPWEEKEDKVFWRGEATGGNHNKRNWMRFHRQRFVAMTNGTWVSSVDTKLEIPDSAPLPDSETITPEIFPLPLNSTRSDTANKKSLPELGEWVNSFTDVAFTHFLCNSANGLASLTQPDACAYMAPHYSIKEVNKGHKQLNAKYIPDLDANGASPEFLKLLSSNSVPIKATIFSEWHDSRLIPWKHFVPMDNTFADFWAIMEYFLGFDAESNTVKPKKSHDRIGKAIAESGKSWAAQVLRREDVLIYTFRLMIEWARICDPNREHLAYTKDLLNM